jgi:polyhydroxybutyrate depolymerase
MKKTALLLISLVMVTVSCQPAPTPMSTPPADPALVIKALVDALNTGDVEAAIAFYADDALRTQQPPPAGQSGIWTGKEQVRGFVKGLVADHFSVELSNLKAAGDKITYTCTFSTDTYRKLGIAPLVAVEEAVLDKSKIKSQPVTITPESVAKIQAALAAAQAKTATPTSVPSATIQQATIRVGNLDRTYLYYAPANLSPGAPLLFAFHGSTIDGEMMRAYTGYEFESLADQHGFIVVYPNGYENSWNDCRKASTLPAKTQSMDDKGFVRALIARFHTDYGINTSQVFAMGYSNGGYMSYRLALELPEDITAIAVVASSLPTEDSSDCRAAGKPIPVLIMNGTGDFLNPYNGGPGKFGAVRSLQASAEYFAKLNGQTNSPKTTRLPHPNPSDPTFVDRTIWNDAGKPEVVLITIDGGGHVVPQSKYAWPSDYGRVTKDLEGPVEIWDFSRQRSLK